jgi:glycosyltransferase involved in cell wall biosynthesis
MSEPVWLLLSRLERGGLERVQLNLADSLRRRGYDVRLVAGRLTAGVGTAHETLEIARRGAWHFPIGLVRALHRERPAIVFTTSNDVACLLLLLRCVAFRSLRVVVTQHLSLSEPRRKARGLRRVKLEIIRNAMRWLLPRADRIVAVCSDLALDMQHELGVDPERIEVIYNPVVTPDFEARMDAPVSWPWPDRNLPTLIFVGRLAREKRLDLLLKAFCELRLAYPARLLILGAGPQEPEVRAWIDARNLATDCKVCGFTEDPLPFIRLADALVLPSDYEGFGIVLVEAMACGTQVVATDCPYGPAEILGNGTYGRLVPRGDHAALARAMQDILQRTFRVPPEVLRQRAQSFTLAASVDAYQRIITSLGSNVSPTARQ